MTNTPSVEERVEEIDNMIYGANLNITQNEYVRLSKEMRPKLIGLVTAQVLLTPENMYTTYSLMMCFL